MRKSQVRSAVVQQRCLVASVSIWFRNGLGYLIGICNYVIKERNPAGQIYSAASMSVPI